GICRAGSQPSLLQPRSSSALFALVDIVLSGLKISPICRDPKKSMRELFDEVAGHSPLDPGEAVRRTSRTPLRKRFYRDVGVAEADGGFAVTLDGKPIKTPSGK